MLSDARYVVNVSLNRRQLSAAKPPNPLKPIPRDRYSLAGFLPQGIIILLSHQKK